MAKRNPRRKPPTIVVTMDGGLINDVFARGLPRGTTFRVVDCDVDGTTDTIAKIPNGNGAAIEAVLQTLAIEKNAAFIAAVEAEIAKS